MCSTALTRGAAGRRAQAHRAAVFSGDFLSRTPHSPSHSWRTHRWFARWPRRSCKRDHAAAIDGGGAPFARVPPAHYCKTASLMAFSCKSAALLSTAPTSEVAAPSTPSPPKRHPHLLALHPTLPGTPSPCAPISSRLPILPGLGLVPIPLPPSISAAHPAPPPLPIAGARPPPLPHPYPTPEPEPDSVADVRRGREV